MGYIRGDLIINKNTLHPSYYVKKMLKEKNMNFLDLIRDENISKIKMFKFIIGKINIDSEIAYLLSNKFNTSINLWWNLKQKYKNKE